VAAFLTQPFLLYRSFNIDMRLVILSFFICVYSFGLAQNRTVGLLTYDETSAYEGLNLFYPHNQTSVFLLNNCGEVVNEWEGRAGHVPGNSAYLTEEGHLIRCSRFFDRTIDSIWAGGGGAIVDALTWEGDSLWSFEQNNANARIHHDVEIMPNGNVLMISWELRTMEESIAVGRSPNKLNLGKLWPDYVLEYSPELDSVVWEWHAWDHLVQFIDPSKPNFGLVADFPERIDINYETNNGNPDWLHINSIDYNPELDQIILSVPHFDELWIIDHSTTTEEAASSSGGRSGRGGDLLFRWGNPLAHGQGEALDQQLFFQHDVQWIDDFVSEDDPLFNKILLFNNRFTDSTSVVNVLDLVFEEDGINYVDSLPETYLSTIKHPQETKLHSTGLSSAQYLPNGNFLILSGRFGYAFEITPEDEIVWEYKVPFNSGIPVMQGDEIPINGNINFRFKRYPIDYPGFDEKDISPKSLLQIETDSLDLCNRIVNVDEEIVLDKKVVIVPNPIDDILSIETHFAIKNVTILDVSGSVVLRSDQRSTNVSELKSGLYFVLLNGRHSLKFIKI